MPLDEERRVLVWSVGGAFLAARIEAVVEVSPVQGGRTETRAGSLKVQPVPGLQTGGEPRHAVILQVDTRLLAIAADEVVGVRTSMLREQSPTPGWLGNLPTQHVAALLQLPDARVAALLAVETLPV